MKIAVLCSSRRGIRFLQELRRLSPHAELAIFSFREETWEPPFLDEIRSIASAFGAPFKETRRVTPQQFTECAGEADLLFAVGWRYLVPPEVFNVPRFGAFVFHDSLLPRYRGFSPTVWAIVNGETRTGATLLEMAARADEGKIIDQRAVAIPPDATISEVMEGVTDAYMELLRENLASLSSGTARRQPQDEALASYCCKRLPTDNEIDWTLPTTRIHNLVRGTSHPYPGAFTTVESQVLRIWKAAPHPSPPRYEGRIPGRVVAVNGDGVAVLTGDGVILLQDVQFDGAPAGAGISMIKNLTTTLGT